MDDGRGGDEATVETVFRDYYENLADRDFEAACAKNAPETTDRMLENVRAANIEVSTCEEAFAAIYATGNAAELVDEVVRTTEVEDVTVAGETAAITWSAETSGERVTLPSTMRRIDGEWRLVDTD
ncbi:MAG TPA: nuclear transport factor 2 family protein [Acidimicrobiales bacterium]|nr:nuclear transport factor 2 family protein [Acidimicrobiales bacterium]